MTITLVYLLLAAVAPPSPPAELQQLQVFEGDWDCEGVEHDAASGKARKTRTEIKAKSDLDGFWYSGKVDQKKTDENPHPLEAKFHWSYDAAQKRFEAGSIDNRGGWTTQSSPGWEGDTLTWVGEHTLTGRKTPVRDVFTRKGNDLHHRYEAQVDGQWKTVGDQACRPDKKKN